MCPLDDASLGLCVLWKMRPLYYVSLEDASRGRCVLWNMRPLYNVSLTYVFVSILSLDRIKVLLAKMKKSLFDSTIITQQRPFSQGRESHTDVVYLG
jgi:hypothetical protein